MTNEFNRDRWNERDYEPSPAELKQMMAEAYRPGILLNKMRFPDDPGAPGCWLGGEPTLPPEIDWPWYTFENEPLVPMHFMAQINLAELPRLEQYPWVPQTGTWFFFYAPIMSAELCSNRSKAADPGGRVFYTLENSSEYSSRTMPLHPPMKRLADRLVFLDSEYLSSRYRSLPVDGLRHWNIDFVEFDNYQKYHFENAAFIKQALEANAGAFSSLEESTSDRRLTDRPNGSKSFDLHYLFGDGEIGTSQMIRFLTMERDSDIKFLHDDYESFVFELPKFPSNQWQIEELTVYQEGPS